MDDHLTDKQKKHKKQLGVPCPDSWQTDLFINPTVWKNYYNSFAS
jgi:hypothetical protein